MFTRNAFRMLGLAALVVGTPVALTAQQDSKSSGIARMMAAAQATNALAAGGSPSVRPLPIGSRQSSSLDANDPTLGDGSHVELWALELQAGQQVTVTMRSREFDTMLHMVQADDPQFTAENDDFEDGSTDSRITFRAPAAGVYGILANSFEGGVRGTYTLEAALGGGQGGAPSGGMGDIGGLMGGGNAGGSSGGNTLSYGQTVNGELTDSDRTLEDGSKFDEYTFTGNAGDRVVISMSSGVFDTFLKLLAASGEEVDDNDDRAEGDTDSEIVVTLPRAGTYRIWANSYEAGSFGAYTLRIEKR